MSQQEYVAKQTITYNVLVLSNAGWWWWNSELICIRKWKNKRIAMKSTQWDCGKIDDYFILSSLYKGLYQLKIELSYDKFKSYNMMTELISKLHIQTQ